MTPRKFTGRLLVPLAALAVLGTLLTGYFQLIEPTTQPPTVPGAEAPAAAVALTGSPVVAGAHHRNAPQDRVPAGTPGVGIGRVLLGQLVVAPREHGPTFDRVRDFGRAWSDPNDTNGCDTREDVLAAWMIDIKTDGCAVIEGQLVDPYTGRHLTHPSQIDIDHVVSLGDAWRSGAARWTHERRAEFANDPRHLVPVSATANRSKGDRPAEKWLPPDTVYHCDYALIIVATKHGYRLTVTAEERNALDRALTTC